MWGAGSLLSGLTDDLPREAPVTMANLPASTRLIVEEVYRFRMWFWYCSREVVVLYTREVACK